MEKTGRSHPSSPTTENGPLKFVSAGSPEPRAEQPAGLGWPSSSHTLDLSQRQSFSPSTRLQASAPWPSVHLADWALFAQQQRISTCNTSRVPSTLTPGTPLCWREQQTQAVSEGRPGGRRAGQTACPQPPGELSLLHKLQRDVLASPLITLGQLLATGLITGTSSRVHGHIISPGKIFCRERRQHGDHSWAAEQTSGIPRTSRAAVAGREATSLLNQVIMLGPGHFLPLADLLPVLWERPSASPPAEALTQALSSYTGRLWWGGQSCLPWRVPRLQVGKLT